MAHSVTIVQLQQQTEQAFVAYVRDAEAAMEQTLRTDEFLWSDDDAARAQKVHEGGIVAEFWSGRGPLKVPDGLVHDWVGAAFIPSATIQLTLAKIQDYNNHKNIYKPEVIDSQLLKRDGNNFQIYMRLQKKKVITVVLDTWHDVHYIPVDHARWCCRSYTTRIAEVVDPGTAKERLLPPDTGYGFLWRLYSYWRFQERDGGVCIECRAISLTRDIPLMLKLIIQPMVKSLPRESLINTLNSTRQALLAT